MDSLHEPSLWRQATAAINVVATFDDKGKRRPLAMRVILMIWWWIAVLVGYVFYCIDNLLTKLFTLPD